MRRRTVRREAFETILWMWVAVPTGGRARAASALRWPRVPRLPVNTAISLPVAIFAIVDQAATGGFSAARTGERP